MLSSILGARRHTSLIIGATGLLVGAFSAPAFSAATIEAITWNVIGLDSNKPATAQPAPQVFPPDRYPVGVEVCNSEGADLTNHKVRFVWDESTSPNYIHLWDSTVNWNDTDGNGAPITDNDSEGLNELPVPTIADGACADVYFWVQIEQVDEGYDYTRDFHIELWDDSATPNDPATNGTLIDETPNSGSTLGLDERRELYVEYLVSQNRNAVLGFSVDGTSVELGGSVAVKPGDTIELVIDAKTATQGYEQLEVFMTLPPDLFTINSVASTYSANSGTDFDAASRLYADGCGWENDPDSPDDNYHNNLSCTNAGKYGGVIQQVYSITVSENFAAPATGQTLIYDFSGSSYHYNADYESSTLTFTVDDDPLVSVGDLSILKASSKSGTESFILTVTNAGATTFPAGDLSIQVRDELPPAFSFKNGGESKLNLQEYDENGAPKGDQLPRGSGNAPVYATSILGFYLNDDEFDADLNAEYGKVDKLLIWNIQTANNLAPGHSIVLTFEVDESTAPKGLSPYTNCAQITTEDDDVSNNLSCATLAPPNWDLSISKQVRSVVENQATFEVSITNLGPDSSTAVLVDDVLPAGHSSPSDFVYSGDVTMVLEGSSNVGSGVLLWDLPVLAAGETASVTYTATVEPPTGSESSEQDLIDRYLNYARLIDDASAPRSGTYEPSLDRIDLFDGQLSNNTATASAAPTLLEIDKSPEGGTITGSNYSYSIVVTRVGVFQAGDVITVVEAPPPGMQITGIAGNGWDCTGSPTLPTTEDKVCTRSVADGDPVDYPAINVGVALNPVPNGAKTYVNTAYVEATRSGAVLFNTFDTDSAVATTLEADLRLAKTASSLTPNIGSTVDFTLTVTNDGPDTATNVAVTDSLPNGYQYVASSIDGGTASDDSAPSSLGWTIDSIATGVSVELTYQAIILPSGSYNNTAEVTASDQLDPDSSPGNDDGDQSEDDEAAVTVVPIPVPVTLSGAVFQESSSSYDGLKGVGEELTNGGGLYVCLDTTPARYEPVGAVNPGLFIFQNVDPNTTYNLVLTTTDSGEACPTDSTLNTNWFSTGESGDGSTADSVVTPGESLSDGKLTVTVGTADFTTATFGVVQADVFDPPFGLKTGRLLNGQPVIRWTMVWINDSPIPVTGAVITDPPPPGTTYVDGSISCVGRGSTTVTRCEFDGAGNSVDVVADFGPETGSPTDEDSAANELLIVFDVTYDADNPEPEYANQGTLSWDPGSGTKVALTDDPSVPGESDPSVVRAAGPATPVPVNPWQLLFALMILLSWLSYAQLRAART